MPLSPPPSSGYAFPLLALVSAALVPVLAFPIHFAAAGTAGLLYGNFDLPRFRSVLTPAAAIIAGNVVRLVIMLRAVSAAGVMGPLMFGVTVLGVVGDTLALADVAFRGF